MLSALNPAESLVPHLKKCGYGDALIERQFEVDQVAIPVAAFAGRPFDSWSACIAAVNRDGDSRAAAAKVQALGASTVFVCDKVGVDWWAMGPEGPTANRLIDWPNVARVFREHKEDLAPSRIYNAKLGRRSRQLWFFDAGLMPAVEKRRGESLLRLVDNAIDRLRAELGAKLDTRQGQEDAYRTVFWLLAAKVLHDKRVENFIRIDLTNVDEVFDRIGKHHGETDRFPPFGKEGRRTIDDVAATFARCGSLADVSSESIAYVYENALIDPTAGGKKEIKGEKPYDIRKELGIHSTPSVLIHHMLSQMWDMIEDIKPEDRNVFEPACGHAPFLTAAMRWLRDWDRRSQPATMHDYLRSHLHGLEADRFAIELARLALTLADEPHGNSWQLTQSDMFLPGVLAKQTKKAHILLANPPYEPFTPAERARYAKAGEAVTAQTKSTEMLLRAIPHLPPGGVFGVVMPQGFLHDKESKPVRERLLADFDLSEIDVFADNLFEHGDHEVAVLTGRRKKPRTKSVALHYRRVREAGMEAFKERLVFSSEQNVSQDRFMGRSDADLRVPEFDEVWQSLGKNMRLSDVAFVGQGFSFEGKDLPESLPTLSKTERRGFKPCFVTARGDPPIYETPIRQWMNPAIEVIQRPRAGLEGQPGQVIVNHARSSRGPWTMKAWLDVEGIAVKGNFLVVRSKTSDVSGLFVWALLNSPIANGYIYSLATKRHVIGSDLLDLPIPSFGEKTASAISSAAQTYMTIAKGIGEFFQPDPSPEVVRRALLEMDAAVLRAYDLPPRLERQLLDLFTGIERKGVGCDFRGYYPPGFTSYLPLHMLISDRFQRAAANATANRFKPGESDYVRNVLNSAAAGTGEE